MSLMPASFSWTKFKSRIYIHAPIEGVLNSFSTPADFEQWWPQEAQIKRNSTYLKKSDKIKAGDSYRFIFFDGSSIEGKFSEIQERKISFSFPDPVFVDIDLKPIDPNITLVELTQKDIPESPDWRQHSRIGCNVGWTFFLTNLKAVRERQIDLRETHPKFSKENIVNQ